MSTRDELIEKAAEAIHATYQTNPRDRFTWKSTSEINRDFYRGQARLAFEVFVSGEYPAAQQVDDAAWLPPERR